MQIFIKSLSGQSVAFDVECSQSVDDLKRMVEEREGVCACEQRLSCNGKSLEGGHALSEYEEVLSDGSSVELLLRIRGGGMPKKKKKKVIQCYAHGFGGPQKKSCSGCEWQMCDYHTYQPRDRILLCPCPSCCALCPSCCALFVGGTIQTRVN